MTNTSRIRFAALSVFALISAIGAAASAAAPRFQALKVNAPKATSVWGILDRDGAGRTAPRYFSSLTGGESGTGVAKSPAFEVATDKLSFTICGHNGVQGAAGENYIALVDANSGEELRKSPPPGDDAMHEHSWDVAELRGRSVRILLHDGLSGAAFAWFGVGRIDAGSPLSVDFSKNAPDDWEIQRREYAPLLTTLAPGAPFKRDTKTFSLIGDDGSTEITCGFAARRLYLLGCTVDNALPLDVCGGLEIHYRSGSPDVIPLMVGFTLDATNKQLSRSEAMHLHRSADPHQHYLVIEPRDEVIDHIRLVAQPSRSPTPRITAVTAETDADSETLSPLPTAELSAEEQAWIDRHAVSADKLELNQIAATIRRDHKLPAEPQTPVRFVRRRLDDKFRSEGVAVADLNGDGVLDIAAGSVYYAGPHWEMIPVLAMPQRFNRHGYSDQFLCQAGDVNGDGAVDLVITGFPGQKTHWLENPGRPGEVWKRHLAVEVTSSESPQFIDVDGDGRQELAFTDPERVLLAKPGADPTALWKQKAVSDRVSPPGHGLGVGDVDGDGLPDLLAPMGWWKQISTPFDTTWQFHPAEFYGAAQLCTGDFDGDGDQDVVSAAPHGYGIGWTEQTPNGWRQHEIASDVSQTHALHTGDINGDGLLDFVTGKRFWAHNGHDPGSFELAQLIWYEQSRADGATTWVRHTIDLDSGVGLHFQVVDVDDDGLLDIVTSNKKGVFYFKQTRQ